ncbi:hypothetical protein OEZ86_011442 [Tetradesmus obliquus]|nr:hypothetical protein OEZ86_011442 [Tetradesmus obliquus]
MSAYPGQGVYGQAIGPGYSAPYYPPLLPPYQQQPLCFAKQEHQDGSSSSNPNGRGKRSAAKQACFAESPASVVLLRALRCLVLWEAVQARQATQADMPTLLQRLAGVGQGAAAAASAGDAAAADVIEVVDLTADCEQSAAEAAQLQALLAGEIDVLLVREQQGTRTRGSPSGVRVKPEREG